MEEFDPTPWEPSPFQYALTGVSGAWITALVLETFVLGEEDTWFCLKEMAGLILNGEFTADLWNPLLLWIVVPCWALYLPIKRFKKYRKHILGIGTLVLTGILVGANLQIELF